VALGRAGNGGIVGASPGSTLMPVRWGPNLSDGQVEAWFDYVTDHGAWVVSCSWGAAAKSFPLSTRIRKAITRCATAGRNGKGCVIIFAAAIPTTTSTTPAAGTLDGFAIHPEVIAVAASNSRDQRSSYSNYRRRNLGLRPVERAVGWGVLTADATDLLTVTGAAVQRGYAAGDYYYDFGAQSSACPLVAGVCALVLAANPALDARTVRDILRSTARKIGDAAGYENGPFAAFRPWLRRCRGGGTARGRVGRAERAGGCRDRPHRFGGSDRDHAGRLHHRSDAPAPDRRGPTKPGVPYYLPKQVHSVEVSYELVACKPTGIEVRQTATITEINVADLTERYLLTYRDLDSAMKTTEFTASLNANRR
jgi:hypothetical protein